MNLGYARVSTAKQDLDRQIDALRQVGIAPKRIYVDKKSGATTDGTAPGFLDSLSQRKSGQSREPLLESLFGTVIDLSTN
ncbi:recombinase family protein [Kocuria rosea]|uniref:recombinase family protein n=1 Tax=Kocuria rosea TaxID=1275 RepID=UPI0023310E1F|nr:recombinase family protein [Kocuria rosea]